MQILSELNEGAFEQPDVAEASTEVTIEAIIMPPETLKEAKLKYMCSWLGLQNYWKQWKKLLKEYENECQYTAEMNELNRKAYEQYKVVPDILKKHFMEDGK